MTEANSWQLTADTMSIKAKQVAGVTTLVVAIVAILSAYHLATLARMSLEETQLRGEMLARAIYQRAREVVPRPATDLATALQQGRRRPLDARIRHRLHAQRHLRRDRRCEGRGDRARVSRPQEGQPLPDQEELEPIIDRGPIAQLEAVYRTRPTRSASRCWPATSSSARSGSASRRFLIKEEFKTPSTPRSAPSSRRC